MRRALLLLVVLAAFVAGCENKYKDPDPVAMGYDYYPLEVGQYRVYEVKETLYFSETPSDRNYQLRERIDTSFTDQTGQLVYKVVRSIRPDATSEWLDDSVMTVAKSSTMVMLTKDNTKYVKLVFPVKESNEWVGDLYNTKYASPERDGKVRNEKDVYRYESVGVPYTVDDKTFNTTTKVIQSEDIDIRRVDLRFEVYAEGMGLVHRVFNRQTYGACQSGVGCVDGYKIESGHEREEILIEHGKL